VNEIVISVICCNMKIILFWTAIVTYACTKHYTKDLWKRVKMNEYVDKHWIPKCSKIILLLMRSSQNSNAHKIYIHILYYFHLA